MGMESTALNPSTPGRRSATRATRSGASVLVDARGLGPSGIGRYLSEILIGLFQDRRFSSIRLIGDPERLSAFCAEQGVAEDLVSIMPYPGGYYSPVSQLAWTSLAAAGRAHADVTFFPHYDVPLFRFPRRSVVTVHDLIHFKVPEAFAAWKRWAAGMLLHRSVTGATRVLTVSVASRRDIAGRFPAAASKIQVVPNGVSSGFRKAPDPAAVRRLGVNKRFLLCVANGRPHKNLTAALEVLARARAAHPELMLVIVGQAYGSSGEMRHAAERLGVRDAVTEFPSVDDATLRALYAGCEVFLFPSLYEGFGLPVLEAMACGAPVVASDQASIPEVAGNAALLAHPRDHDGMAALVARLMNDRALRAEMIRRGHARAATFTWESAVEQTLDALIEVAAGRPVAT